MDKSVVNYYNSLRQIFTVCPDCGEIHRLSDCKIFQKAKPVVDWKEKIDKELDRLDNMELVLLEKIESAKEAARLVGRKNAARIVKKMDPIFAPLGLDCNDCKVIFHPVDFVVFRGMNKPENKVVKEIVILDKDRKSGPALSVQKSVEKTIAKGNVEWITLRVIDDGVIQEE